MESYRKRRQRGWCYGKRYKAETNRKERQFGKREVYQIFNENSEKYSLDKRKFSIEEKVLEKSCQ